MSKEYGKVAKSFGIKLRIGRWGITLVPRIQWIIMRLQGRYDYPRPSIVVPLDGWVTDPQEIQNSLIQDGFATKRKGNKVYVEKEL